MCIALDLAYSFFLSVIVSEKLIRNDTNRVLYYQQKNKLRLYQTILFITEFITELA
jgi:hypothetical protein